MGKSIIKNTDNKLDILTEDQGFILVTALLFMVILTVMGAASMSIRNTEQQITLNSEVFQHNFYTLEAVTLEGAATIDNLSDSVLSDPAAYPPWLKVESPAIDLRQNVQWPSGVITPANTSLTAAPTDITPNNYDNTAAGDRIWFAAVDKLDVNGEARCEGGSLTDSTKVEKCYEVFGMYDMENGGGRTYSGKMMLQVGYKKVVYL